MTLYELRGCVSDLLGSHKKDIFTFYQCVHTIHDFKGYLHLLPHNHISGKEILTPNEFGVF